MYRFKNHFVPTDDLYNFLSNIRDIEKNCQDDSYVTDKIANRLTLSGEKLRYNENFYLSVREGRDENGRDFGNFYNYEIPRELQKRIVCLIEQYLDEELECD